MVLSQVCIINRNLRDCAKQRCEKGGACFSVLSIGKQHGRIPALSRMGDLHFLLGELRLVCNECIYKQVRKQKHRAVKGGRPRVGT